MTLARAGATVLVCARCAVEVAALRDAMIGEGLRAIAVQADVTDAAAIVHLADALDREKMGRLDILVNNVGGAPRFGQFAELSDEDWYDTFTLNVMSGVRLSRCFLAALRRSTGGRIINIGSLSALEPGGSNPHYCASKAAQLNFSKYLAGALARDRITVNTICAGPVQSAAWDRLFDQRSADSKSPRSEIERETLAREIGKIPLGRLGRAEEVAQLVAFLASDAGAWITGAAFVVDGGKSHSVF